MLSDLLLRNPDSTGPTYVEDVFSTYVYTGTGAAQSINTGINLTANDGLVWIKCRSTTGDHALYDTVRGATKEIAVNTIVSSTQSQGLTAFSSSGFDIGTLAKINTNNAKYVAWTFRKAKRFLDVVSWTGNNTNGRVIPHSLGVVPGLIIVKNTSTGAFVVHHASLGTSLYFQLNATDPAASSTPTYIQSTSSASFSVSSNALTNGTSGYSYVAYVFATDDQADGLIKCGNYTGNGSATGPTVTLGWEPQYILIKRADSTGAWYIYDTVRGLYTGGSDFYVNTNSTAAEVGADWIDVSATGFSIKTGTIADLNASSGNYVYMAIRRGPMRVPTDGSKVLEITARNGNTAETVVGSAFPADFAYVRNRAAYTSVIADRLRGNPYIQPTAATVSPAEVTDSTYGFSANPWDTMTGFRISAGGTANANNLINATNTNTYINYALRRAPQFFDISCYTGDGVNNRIVNHNLGVVPELILIKQRDATGSCYSFNSTAGGSWWLNYISFSNSAAQTSFGGNGLVAAPTATTITLGTSTLINGSGSKYVAYLFASCPGVSKIGTYTGNGSSIDIDCGFSAGARFVMVKRINATGNWTIFDTTRGIIAANDPYIISNSAIAETTTVDSIDPISTGFTVVQNTTSNLNVSSGTYLYLAIA